MTKSPDATKFLHFRYSGEGGVFARGGLTIAFAEREPGVIVHASAKCHINDNFRKHEGRAKAGGRLLSKQFSQTFNGTEEQFLNAIDQDLELYNQAYSQFHGGLTLARKYNGKRKQA